MELYWMGLSCLSRFSSLISSPGRHILFIFIFHSSNEWWRWPRQSGRARKDKSLFHTAASIYWCCPQRDGSLANASFWWHWGCFGFFYLGNASRENWTEKLSNCVCALFFVWVLVLISAFLGFCLLWALAPILLILVGTPRSCGFGQRRICLSSLCSNTYYWEWTRPGDQDRSYLEIWTYFPNSIGRLFWLRLSCMFNVISNCKDSMKKKPFSFRWFHSLYLAKKRCLWPYLIFVNFGTPLHCKRHAKKSALIRTKTAKTQKSQNHAFSMHEKSMSLPVSEDHL